MDLQAGRVSQTEGGGGGVGGFLIGSGAPGKAAHVLWLEWGGRCRDRDRDFEGRKGSKQLPPKFWETGSEEACRTGGHSTRDSQPGRRTMVLPRKELDSGDSRPDGLRHGLFRSLWRAARPGRS